MIKAIGKVKRLCRYPVKSMAGQDLEALQLGWHGFAGDRRFALHLVNNASGFPWLTAGKLPRLLLYKPVNREANHDADLPTHVLTPDGRELDLRGDELTRELSSAYGSPLEIMRLDQGIFDEAKVSVINETTIEAIASAAAKPLAVERFRPNVLIESFTGKPFEEDDWVGKTLRFGQTSDAPGIHIQMRDIRCAMINFDPLTGTADARVLKTVVRLNNNFAGVYASVIQPGVVSTNDTLYLEE